eukprot:6179906-Pleurochrysis_carterae.AAC.2
MRAREGRDIENLDEASNIKRVKATVSETCRFGCSVNFLQVETNFLNLYRLGAHTRSVRATPK